VRKCANCNNKIEYDQDWIEIKSKGIPYRLCFHTDYRDCANSQRDVIVRTHSATIIMSHKEIEETEELWYMSLLDKME